MARIKGGMNAKKRHNRVLKMAKGLSLIHICQGEGRHGGSYEFTEGPRGQKGPV